MWFVCHHILVVKCIVISCLSFMLKILINASNNNYATDLLAFLIYCLTLCRLKCLCFFPVWCLGKDVGFDFYRFLVIAFSSSWLNYMIAILDFDNFKMWHTGTMHMHHQNVNIKHN